MAFISIPDSWIQVGLATVQRLFQRIKDNFDSLFGSIGTLQGDNIINGFFEVVEDIAATPLRPLSWDVAEYLGGTAELDDTGSSSKGTYAMKFIHPGGAGNGGGDAKSDYHPIDSLHTTRVAQVVYYATQAAVHIKVQIDYFDEGKLFLSTETLLNLNGGVPTSRTLGSWELTVPASARFMKVYLIGGDTDKDPGSSTDIFFDNISVEVILGNVVDQNAMKTGTNRVNGTITSGSAVTINMNDYSFFPSIFSTPAGSAVSGAAGL